MGGVSTWGTFDRQHRKRGLPISTNNGTRSSPWPKCRGMRCPPPVERLAKTAGAPPLCPNRSRRSRAPAARPPPGSGLLQGGVELRGLTNGCFCLFALHDPFVSVLRRSGENINISSQSSSAALLRNTYIFAVKALTSEIRWAKVLIPGIFVHARSRSTIPSACICAPP